MKKKKTNQKPLTLEALIAYNQEILFPALDERFDKVDKKIDGLEIRIDGLNKRVDKFEKEFKNFKNKSLTNQDKMLKKLDTLLTEKKVRAYQEEKQKKFWAIIIKALKEHQILSPKELDEIARLEIF